MEQERRACHSALWQQIDDAKARLKSPVEVIWVKAHQNNGSLNDKVDVLANQCARAQEAYNAPALQDELQDRRQPVIGDAAAIASLLVEARDTIARIATAEDDAALDLVRRISRYV